MDEASQHSSYGAVVSRGRRTATNANAIVKRKLEIQGCSVFCAQQRDALPLLPAPTSKFERVMAPSIPLKRLPQEYERPLSRRPGISR
jgi:hypothetical protein